METELCTTKPGLGLYIHIPVQQNVARSNKADMSHLEKMPTRNMERKKPGFPDYCGLLTLGWRPQASPGFGNAWQV